MENNNYLNNIIYESENLYQHDLLKDFLQDEYKEEDYLHNFYHRNSLKIRGLETKKIPKCIYKLLWNWDKKNYEKCPDIMNSFKTYMNDIVDSIIKEDQSLKDRYGNKLKVSENLISDFINGNTIVWEKIEKQLNFMNQLAKWSDTIGNFVLLPQTKRGDWGENIYKNTSSIDRMDVYLNNLKKYYSNTHSDEEEKFKKYINENYLWDYVDKNYDIISLVHNSDNNKFGIKIPNYIDCYKSFAENTIKIIKRRGMFMEIMIRLSSEDSEQFKQVKDTKNTNGYAEVIGAIETLKLSPNLKSLIMSFKMEII